MRHSNVARAVFDAPWAVVPEHLAVIAEVVHLRLAGTHMTDQDVRARLELAAASQGPRGGARVSGSVAIIPIYGTIMSRANLFTEFSGGATITGLQRSFREAISDETIGSIVFDIDSPGGQVDGVEELASEIRAARGQKPMVAIANTLMASAAYWLGAQADQIYASPSSKVGSIGIVHVHEEESRANDMAGITVTVIRSTPGKMNVNPWEALTDEARAQLQEITDDYYAQFVNAVAKGRVVPAARVRAEYGQGRVFTAKRAMDAGLVDKIGTLEDAIRAAASGKVSRPPGTGALLEGDITAGALPPIPDDAFPEGATALEQAVTTRDIEAQAALAIARAKANRR